MPPTLREETVANLSAFTTLIEQLSANFAQQRWYRGCGKQSHRLKPTLYRHPTINDADQLIRKEREMLSQFRQRSIPFRDVRVETEFETLFVMQHYGVPTRLLDWTQSPYVALFFALADAHRDQIAGTHPEDAAVWVLDPQAWNRVALNYLTSPDRVFSLGDTELSGYDPALVGHERPGAMFGSHNSPRIVAQRGVFTVFGKSTEPLEQVYISSVQDQHGADIYFPQDTLVKIVVPEAAVGNFLRAILSIGITDSVVFPDLGGISNEIKRAAAYRV
jgi:hypothetical protein